MGFQPPLLLRARQGGVAPGTMPKVLHVPSRGRSSTILDEGPDSTIGIIQSFHALRAQCAVVIRGGSLEPALWPPEDFIFTVVHFKCPTVCCSYARLFTI